MSWSLPVLLDRFHRGVEQTLQTAREAMGHPDAKGDTSERIWIKMLKDYLPSRYETTGAFVVDSRGDFSQQIDVLVYDRQYSPLVFKFEGQKIVPAESVYAVFEAKQALNADRVEYAQKKVASVRKLFRTSARVPTLTGLAPAKEPGHILGGVLTLESDWNPPLGASLQKALEVTDKDMRLDLGCVAARGMFFAEGDEYIYSARTKSSTAFLFELIKRLQDIGNVAMIDIHEYAKWLD